MSKSQLRRTRTSKRSNDEQRRAQMSCWDVITAVDALPMRVPRAARITFAQVEDAGNIASVGSGVEVDGAIQFRLTDLDGSANFGALFDQYRIKQVSCSFIPLYPLASTSSSSSLGQLITALDYDDSGVQTASQLRQKESCMETPGYGAQTRTLKPRVAMAAYSGAFTSFANMEAPWIDISSSSVQHYGVKYALENCTFTTQNIYKIAIRFVLEFRQVQ